ncbi:MAG: hypothetical protein R2854_03955 [Caldilineaceae bacterium]
MTPEYAYITGLPALEAALPTPYSPDSAAADHYALLGLTVFPCASAFLDEAGQVGGAWSAQVAANVYRVRLSPVAAGLTPITWPRSWAALAFLVGAGSRRRDRQPDPRRHAHAAAVRFSPTQLAPWLQPFLRKWTWRSCPSTAALADLATSSVRTWTSVRSLPPPLPSQSPPWQALRPIPPQPPPPCAIWLIFS